MNSNSNKHGNLDKRRKVERFTILIFVAFIVTAITIALLTPKSISDPKIPSLNFFWNSLEKRAYLWQSDAYLTGVSLGVKGESRGNIFAEYHSPSVPEETTLFVEINAIGQITSYTQEFSKNVSTGNNKPISKDDWTIDSRDALKIFAQNHGVSSCFSVPGATITLLLSSSTVAVPAWELDVFDCPNEPNLQTYFIDAQTGESIDVPWK